MANGNITQINKTFGKHWSKICCNAKAILLLEAALANVPLGDIQDQVDANTACCATNTSAIADLLSQIQSNDTDIADLLAQIQSNDTDITNLQQCCSDNEDAIEALDTRVEALEEDLEECCDYNWMLREIQLGVNIDPNPPPLGICLDHLMIEVYGMGSDTDFTGFSPNNMCPGSRVTIRKAGTDPFVISWTCPNTGIVYDHMDTQGDYIELYWDGSKLTI